jgi:subtilisin family serine protease
MTLTSTAALTKAATALTRDQAKILAHYAAGEASKTIVINTGFDMATVGRVLDEIAGNDQARAHALVLEYKERAQATAAARGVPAPALPGPSRPTTAPTAAAPTAAAAAAAAAAEVAKDSVATLAAMTAPAAPATSVATPPVVSVDAIGELLDQAEATQIPKLQRTAGKVRDLLADLRAQLAEHTRETQLRTEQAELEQRLAVIREQLRPRRQQLAPAPDAASSTGTDTEPAVDTKKVRAWAADQGLDCSAHGRIPGAVLTAYREAHQ